MVFACPNFWLRKKALVPLVMQLISCVKKVLKPRLPYQNSKPSFQLSHGDVSQIHAHIKIMSVHSRMSVHVGTGRDCGGWGSGEACSTSSDDTNRFLPHVCTLATSSLKWGIFNIRPTIGPQNSASKIANFRSACTHNPFYQL